MSADIDREMEEYFETMPFLEKIGIEEATIEDGTAQFRVPYDESNTNHTVVHGGGNGNTRGRECRRCYP
jgi:acyl-coenzyme A thioesterase PaaI-like protein